MLPEHQRDSRMCQQMGALLLKHILVKWRRKKQSLQELVLSLVIPLLLYLSITGGWSIQHLSAPSHNFGRVDEFHAHSYGLQYTPVTHTTRQIMQHVASDSFMKGIRIFEKTGESTELEINDTAFFNLLEVNFKDDFSYELSSPGDPTFHLQRDNMDHHSESCSDAMQEDYVICAVMDSWVSGFVALQANIDAAIIQLTSNHTVMEELRSVMAVQMESAPFRISQRVSHDFLVVCAAMAFSPLVYFMSLNVAKDRKKLKELMRIMGLQDVAFWCVRCPLTYLGQINQLGN